jgi:hypothetical protein
VKALSSNPSAAKKKKKKKKERENPFSSALLSVSMENRKENCPGAF